MAQVTMDVRPASALPPTKGPHEGSSVPRSSFEADEILTTFRSISVPIERYLYLRKQHLQHPKAYYSALLANTEEILPYIYTPTVGEACERYHELGISTHGLYLSLKDKGHILDKLRSWPRQDINVIVATDGERILGLGDLGTGGMGISEGKITLYTAAAGVDPASCLPICLDVGTNSQRLLADPTYPGLRQKRITGAEYDEFLNEFMTALRQWRPDVLLQFEDFGNNNAFRLLSRYRELQLCFNDDIQGTASITLAALLSALRVTGQSLKDTRVLFLGAGEAGTGIGELIAQYLVLRHGLSLQEARGHCYYLDSKGLICSSRTGLQHHKETFAHDVAYQPDLKSAIRALRPQALVGVSTIAKSFDREVFELLLETNERPIVFPLSNPTSKSECTFTEAMEWTQGRVLFASGSPFDPLPGPDGNLVYPAQANNAYIFPAVGHAAVLTRASRLTDDVFVRAAEELAAMPTDVQLRQGRLFPPFQEVRDVSRVIMARVAEHIIAQGLGTQPLGCKNWEQYSVAHMWSAAQLPSQVSHL